ncbi:MAG TPA: protein kinase [Thermoanaerobaculia bacterium]
MTLEAGTRIGPYEILAPLGAGGMGEVYRAHDGRLHRDVALKILPPDFASDADRLRRFEQEGRAASALSHPNVLAVFDVGFHGDQPYVVSELLEGETLRERLAVSPLAPRKALEVAVQIARGLAAAHEKGIIHRDLKPENIFVTRDGRVKILDFGLARLTRVPSMGREDTEAPTTPLRTESGLVIGTAGYMSPEQVRGKSVDHRTDIFSFGAILYEVLTGQRAFRRESGIETMNAILKEEPERLAGASVSFTPGMDRVLRRCLEKNPEERFHSASDLAFALESMATDSGESSAASTSQRAVSGLASTRRPRRGIAAAAAVLLLAGLLAASYWLGRRGAPAELSLHQLTFRRGIISTARFAGGETVVYGAAWDGDPYRLFTARLSSPEATLLPLPAADLLSVSQTEELAISLDRRFLFGWMQAGTLARVALAGGAPREIAENVLDADWGPVDALAVVRSVQGRHRLEYPIGTVLAESGGWMSHPRVSRDGARVAYIEHSIYGDDRGLVALVDREGRRRTLTEEYSSAQGLAWSPDGKEVWFSASREGVNAALRAVTLAGKERTILASPGRVSIRDAAADGRVLLSRETVRGVVMVSVPGGDSERDISWLDSTSICDMTADGSAVLLTESGQAGGRSYGVFLRRTDGSPAVRLGNGQGTAISPDGRWVLSILPGRTTELRVLPTGPGDARALPNGDVERHHWARFLPHGDGVLISANARGEAARRIYVQDLKGGRPRPVTPPGIAFLLPVPPDGRHVCTAGPDGKVVLYPLDGSPPRELPGLKAFDIPLAWTADGSAVWVRRAGSDPVALDRVDVATGRGTPARVLVPRDPAGLQGIGNIVMTPDGSRYSYTYFRVLSDLFLVEGLR